MPESRASTHSLVGGVLALDFANTGGDRGAAKSTEHLQRPIDLLHWARHARGIDAETAERLSVVVAADADTGDRLLRLARELRDAIYSAGSAIAGSRPPAEADLKTLKSFGARAVGNATLKFRSSGGYAFDFSQAQPETAVLGPIVWSALDLIAGQSLDRVKQCPECGWLFFDQSKNNSRRWCDMATCGNRTKLRRHRHREHP